MDDLLTPLGFDSSAGNSARHSAGFDSSAKTRGTSGGWSRRDGENRDAAREGVLVRLADVAPRPRQWLWPGRLAADRLTLVAGDGFDVEHVCHDLAARVSRGEEVESGVVVLVSGDDPACTLRPRLDAAGADPSRIVLLRAARHGSAPDTAFERPVSLWRDLPLVENSVAQTRECRLLVIAAPEAGPGGERSATARELGELFASLAGLAARQRVAVVAVVESQGRARDDVGRLRQLARRANAAAVWVVVRDEVRPGRRLLVPSVSEPDMMRESLAFTVAAGRVEWEAEPVALVDDDVWDAISIRTAKTEIQTAAEWLLGTLAFGPVESKVLFEQARECGIAGITLRRAATKLGLRPVKPSFDGPWIWGIKQEAGEEEKVES